MSEPLLQLDAVEVSYGQAKALNGVSLKVPGGKIVSLLGGNASGKSTTMKTILGLVRPATGRLLLDGQDITRWPTSRRVASGIASVPEARRIFGPMTVEENLLMGAYTRRSRADIREDLEAQYDRFPRLGERRRQAAGTMSGGEQQMLAFARALLSRRLVDEVLETIATLNTDLGLAVLMVEQQAELALSIAHHGYVLATGNLVLEGAAGELLDNPRVQEAYLGRTARNGDDDDQQA